MTDDFDAFEADDVPILHRVRMFGPDDTTDTAVVELSFGDFTAYVCVDHNDDTLMCTRARPEPYLSANHRAVLSGFWKTLEGQALTDAWQMHNDRGYRDAIQLRFREAPAAGRYTLIQFVATASRMTISQLDVVREHR